jgi:glycine cleavage system H protein
MNFPKELKYAPTHEWAKDLGGGVFEVGLSAYAVEQLGDVVFVEMPEVGTAVEAGKPFGNIESVKAVSDMTSPVSGTVKEVNPVIADNPACVNEDCYANWLIRVEGTAGADLKDAAAYEASLPAA